MNNKVIILIIIALMLVGSYWYFSRKTFENIDVTQEASENENRDGSEIDQLISNFIKKYQATRLEDGGLYTYQLEDLMVKTGKPVVFVSSLDDIFRQKDKLFLRFTPSLSWYDLLENGLMPDIFYTLDGCTEKVDEITNSQRNNFGTYVVVAEIKSIKKPIIKLDGSAYNEEVELEFGEPQSYLATGTCIDFAFVE